MAAAAGNSFVLPRLDAEAMKRALADARPERLAQYRKESLAKAKPLRAKAKT